MALLGAYLVITLIMVTIIQKIGIHYSFARWLLCSTGLIRYLYPTDHELRSLAGVPKEKWKGKNKRNSDHGKNEKQTFHVPKNLEFQLESAQVTLQDVVFLRFYSDYQWIVDFSLYSLVVYIVSEAYTFFIPTKDEVNLTMVWCVLVILCTYKLLFSLTVQYFHGEESMGERSLIILAWFGYLLVAMAILIVDENILETGLESAYTTFNSSAHTFLEKQGVNTQGPASKLMLKLSLAVWCATIGALFTFPGFRVAQMHWDAVRMCKERPLFQILLHMSFTAPFIGVMLWLRPITKDYLTRRVFSGHDYPLLTEEKYDSLRLLVTALVVLQRLPVMPTYLQAYLNLAHSRLIQLKKEAGRITNVELQKKIAVVFYYMCVVALQYVIPLILCLFTLFMYKTLGEYSWTEGLRRGVLEEECPATGHPPSPPSASFSEQYFPIESVQHIAIALSSLKQVVLSQEVVRGLLGFSSWWTLFAWFTSSALGLLYQSYFTHV